MIYSDGNNVIIIYPSAQVINIMSSLIQSIVSIKNDNVSSNKRTKESAEYFLSNLLLDLNNPVIDVEIINKISEAIKSEENNSPKKEIGEDEK
jgi:hypothetical protein